MRRTLSRFSFWSRGRPEPSPDEIGFCGLLPKGNVMRIEISDAAQRMYMEPLRIGASRVRGTVESYDQVEIVVLSEDANRTRIGIYLRTVSIGDRTISTLVIAKQSDEVSTVLSVYRIPQSILARCVNGVTPLAVLETLADEFGIEIKIGNKTGKFVFSEQIPGGPENPTFIQGDSSPKDSFYASLWVRYVKNGNPPYWDCALGFALNMDRYMPAALAD